MPVPTQPIRLLIPQGSRGENIEQTVKDFMAYASNIFLLQTGYQVCAALWVRQPQSVCVPRHRCTGMPDTDEVAVLQSKIALSAHACNSLRARPQPIQGSYHSCLALLRTVLSCSRCSLTMCTRKSC